MSLLKGFTPGGYCLGDADSIKPSAEALRQTGLTMLRLKADIERSISALVPGEWDGAAGLGLFTTKGASPYLEYRYGAADILLFGRESAGVPDDVVRAADARLVIPIKPGLRSLNVAMAAAMALGEALRQTGSATAEAAR